SSLIRGTFKVNYSLIRGTFKENYFLNEVKETHWGTFNKIPPLIRGVRGVITDNICNQELKLSKVEEIYESKIFAFA
ncbi:MAG TPA: hypothetical protein DEG17_09795, partial [Cyanobacteria bacterium UBA11149]|nr:hypothetical protein [Cyanobacteria bacterium UBA11149]